MLFRGHDRRLIWLCRIAPVRVQPYARSSSAAIEVAAPDQISLSLWRWFRSFLSPAVFRSIGSELVNVILKECPTPAISKACGGAPFRMSDVDGSVSSHVLSSGK